MIRRLYETIRYLRWQQVFYRFYYPVKRVFFRTATVPEKALTAAANFPVVEMPFIGIKNLYEPADNCFHFLNAEHSFCEKIDWDYNGLGRLWSYNLNYFEWLLDEQLSVSDRNATIRDFLKTSESQRQTASEPYPISLRSIHWILFSGKYGIKDKALFRTLHADLQKLAAFPEYHLLGNHLLENAFALFCGAHFFDEEKWLLQSTSLLREELKEQILPDGGHYELSPMYHAQLLYRLLICIGVARISGRFKDEDLDVFLNRKAGDMLGWLKAFSFRDGSFALTNDAAKNIAPDNIAIFRLAEFLNICTRKKNLKESGYRKVTGEGWEMLLDIGDIQPDYQPGHAHADTFSFCLNIDNNPFIVDTGISSYANDESRKSERGTAAHNTISVAGINSSDTWSAFRTGRRARVKVLEENEKRIRASHNGYKYLNIFHERIFEWTDHKIEIKDEINQKNKEKIYTLLHFHPRVVLKKISENVYMADNTYILLHGVNSIYIDEYQFNNSFNERKLARKLVGIAENSSTIVIELNRKDVC